MKIFSAGFRLSYRETVEFGLSSLLSVVSNLAYVFLFLMFWNILLQRVAEVPGWSLGEMAIYLAFAEFFHAVVGGIGDYAIKAYVYIISGRFDTILTRPADPRMMLIVLGTNLSNLIRSIPSVVVLLIVAVRLGVHINAFGIFMGLLASTVAAIALILVYFTGSFISFWIGSTKFVEEIAQSLESLTKYPLTILGNTLRLVFTLLIPIGFAATEPALSSLSKTNPWIMIVGALFLLSLWVLINEIVWRKGKSIYESNGG
ncbi:MAG: ABC-2 family transporter protein [Anaerolineaceae bacterium]|nr:ABC-2 family transporter protein [Anaerolineaceae bacterium]